MDPLVATGLVSLGRDLIDRVLDGNAPSGEATTATAGTFESALRAHEDPASQPEIIQRLNALAHDPDVRAWLENTADGKFILSRTAEGGFQLNAGEDTILTLAPTSTAGQVASELFGLLDPTAESRGIALDLTPGQAPRLALLPYSGPGVTT